MVFLALINCLLMYVKYFFFYALHLVASLSGISVRQLQGLHVCVDVSITNDRIAWIEQAQRNGAALSRFSFFCQVTLL